jgi:hypothetical protein
LPDGKKMEMALAGHFCLQIVVPAKAGTHAERPIKAGGE